MVKYRTLFLVDDDEDDQLLFGDAVNEIDQSIKYYIAQNGIEALRKLRSNEISPDMIFLDLNMPLMNGFEFLVEFRKISHTRNIPVVIFTTSNSPEHAMRTHALGASAFLTKPAGFHILRSKLATILASDFEHAKRTFHLAKYLV